MEQHPIPQDVTGFQFKLIGAMTVKQFGFVATGVILAVIIYYIKVDNVFWILAKFILIPLCGGSGVIIAFVPIDGRPIDVMSSNFVKALFSPNQYIYKREGKQLSFMKISVAKAPVKGKTDAQTSNPAVALAKKSNQLDEKEAKLRAFLMSSQSGIRNDLDKKEAAFLKTLTISTARPGLATIAPGAPLTRPTAPIVKPATPVAAIKPLPTPAPVAAPVAKPIAAPTTPTPSIQSAAQTPSDKQAVLTQQENMLEQQLTQAKQEEAANPVSAAHQKVLLLSKQIEEIHTQKQQLEQELSQLKTQLATQRNAPTTSSVPTPPPAAPAIPTPAQDPQHVRTIPQSVTKKAGLPHVSDTPNVVLGIVKDPRGNVLSNILVEVKDKDGNPVRAFKTNPLGQFASATPLSPGTYTMELEDPKKQNRFDIIQITANNQILPAMEVISHDSREDLRKQLFAN